MNNWKVSIDDFNTHLLHVLFISKCTHYLICPVLFHDIFMAASDELHEELNSSYIIADFLKEK